MGGKGWARRSPRSPPVSSSCRPNKIVEESERRQCHNRPSLPPSNRHTHSLSKTVRRERLFHTTIHFTILLLPLSTCAHDAAAEINLHSEPPRIGQRRRRCDGLPGTQWRSSICAVKRSKPGTTRWGYRADILLAIGHFCRFSVAILYKHDEHRVVHQDILRRLRRLEEQHRPPAGETSKTSPYFSPHQRSKAPIQRLRGER